MIEPTAHDVVFTRRPGRSPILCVVCGREILPGGRYLLAYRVVEQGGKRTTLAEASHLACRAKEAS